MLFFTGLIIGMIAGMLSWLAAAAFLETQRTGRGMIANLVVQPELVSTGRKRDGFRARRGET